MNLSEAEIALHLLILTLNRNHNATIIYRLSFTARHHLCVVKWTKCASLLFFFTTELKDCRI